MDGEVLRVEADGLLGVRLRLRRLAALDQLAPQLPARRDVARRDGELGDEVVERQVRRLGGALVSAGRYNLRLSRKR
jgi:hypothetical protein